MRRIAPVLLLSGLLAGSAMALTVETSWTAPKVYGYPPPADLSLEGAVQVHFQGDEPMTPLDQSWLYQQSADHWWAWQSWSLEAARTVTFVSDDGDTVTITAARQPQRPLNPTAHTGLILDVATERSHLWHPDSGIYVWGLHENCLQTGEAWERTATVTALAPSGAVLWTEPIGLRINGQSTRYHPRKGLRAYFDHDAGTLAWLQADVFGDGTERFGRLVFKSTLLPGMVVSSAMIEPLHQQLGHVGSRHRLAGLYLEGDYWGAYNIRERLDDHLVEVTHELAEDGDYTFIKDMESVEGDPAQWTQFLETYAVPPQDYTAHQWFVDVSTRLDLGSYMDWLLLNITGASGDNGWVNNVALLRLNGGPWRYVMWDEEGLFHADNLEANHFRFYAADTWAEYEEFRPPVWSMGNFWPPHQPWRDLFRGLMQNAEFRWRFSTRLDELRAGPLSESALHARLDSLAADHGPEMALHEERWGLAPGTYLDEVARVRQWLSDRLPVVDQLAGDFFEHFAEPVELVEFSADEQLDGAHLAWRTVRERGNQGFSVWRTLAEGGQFERIASWTDHPELEGAAHSDDDRLYSFVDTAVPPTQAAWYQLRHELSDGTVTTHAWVERSGPPPLPLVRLNEFMADNDTTVADEAGEFDDWLELVNIGTGPVSLAGLAVADDAAATAPWPLPDMVLEAGEHLLIWCDNDPDQGPLHADFKLSAGGESAALFLLDGAVTWLVDTVDFGPQLPDVSVGRLPDGTGPWMAQERATPGASNSVASAAPVAGPGAARLRSVSPNPCNPRTAITYELATDGPATLELYDVAGRLVRSLAHGVQPAGRHQVTWDGRDDGGREAPSGTYLVRLRAGGSTALQKLMLVR